MPLPQFVYVLESVADRDRHYIGLTADVSHRVEARKAGLSWHTAKHRPWRLLVTIEFADAACAVRFEKFLKPGSGRAFARRHVG
jgi:putative endonuclease